MVRSYVKIRDEQRVQLLKLIHDEGYKIKQAAKIVGIAYANAKVINRTYTHENRMTRIYNYIEKTSKNHQSKD